MIPEILNTFRKLKEKESENFVLDNYVLNSIGEFAIIKETETGFEIVDTLEQTKNKPIEKTNKYYNFIKAADFYSNLISMNKPVGCKQVQSCNCYAFFVKQKFLAESESVDVLKKITDDYYNGILKLAKRPEKFNKKGKERKFNIEEELCEQANLKAGEIDCEFIEKLKLWIKETLPRYREKYLPTEFKGTDTRYLKFFILREIDNYKREYYRYVDQKIFLKTDECVRDSKGIIRGLHGYSSSFGADKAFLKPNTRKTNMPYLYTAGELLELKNAFDYIISFTKGNKKLIYVTENSIVGYKIGEFPEDDLHGLLIVTQLNKNSLEITNCYSEVDYIPNLPKSFLYNNFLEAFVDKKDFEYGHVETLQKFEDLINIVVFKGFLKSNYFAEKIDAMDDSELSYNIQLVRDSIFTYFYKNKHSDIFSLLETAVDNLIIHSVLKKDEKWTKKLLNFKFSLIEYFKGEEKMTNFLETKTKLREELNRKDNEEMKTLKTDDEYAVAIGQLAYYLISQSDSKDRRAEEVNNICNSRSSLHIKNVIYNLHLRYANKISKYNPKFERLMALVMCYNDVAQINRGLILGSYYSPNILYEKKEEDKEETANEIN